MNQKIAVRQLLRLGYRADVVTDGRRAVEALAKIPYDLVLMDCQMPHMDGYEATAEIRRREGKTKHTPIVAMTAHAMESDRAKCIAAGMDDYIPKPVKSADLEHVLDRLLSNAGASADVDGMTTPQDAKPPVDIERLHMAIGDDPEDLCHIVTEYLDQVCESLDELDVAIELGNAGAVNLIARNCAGVSANCGMTAVVEPFRELERMGLEDRLAGAAALSKTARIEFDRVRLFLETNLELLTPQLSQ
ncbi:MAG: response regulator [Acidobacteriota bacterium]